MAQVKFYVGTLARYKAIAEKDPNGIYVLEDAGKIFRGTNDITTQVTFVNDHTIDAPAKLFEGKILVKDYTDADGERRCINVYMGDESNTPKRILPEILTDTREGAQLEDDKLAVGRIIKKFVNDSLADTSEKANKAFIDASFDNATGKLAFTPAGGAAAKNVDLTGIAHDIEWDSSAYKLTVKNYGAENLEINIPKDFFLQNGEYIEDYEFNAGTISAYHGPAIHLVVNIHDGTDATKKDIYIPVKDLVDTYTVGSTDTVALAMDEHHNITANVVFHDDGTEESKILIKSAKGISQSTKSVKDITDAISAEEQERTSEDAKIREEFAAADTALDSKLSKQIEDGLTWNEL